jgi:hypothetical protein
MDLSMSRAERLRFLSVVGEQRAVRLTGRTRRRAIAGSQRTPKFSGHNSLVRMKSSEAPNRRSVYGNQAGCSYCSGGNRRCLR